MTRPRLRSWRAPLACVALALCTICTVCTISSSALADDDIEATSVSSYAIQRRLFPIGLELNAGVGFLPLNAFSKGFTLGGSVTYHFSSAWAWEIGQGEYVLARLDTGLKQQLLDNFGVQPTQLSVPQVLTSTNIVFTPFYGKLAGLNRTVSHIELFFPFGLALGRYENPGAFEEGIDLGLGLRWFLGTHVSLRLDARDYLLVESFKSFTVTNELLFALGISFAFGGDER